MFNYDTMIQRSTLLVFFILAAAPALWAQDLSLKGILQDGQEKFPLPGATVKLTAAGDTSRVAGMVTDARGAFTFEHLSPQVYRLTVSFLGYKEMTRTIRLGPGTQDAGILYLERGSTTLKSVTVEGLIPPVQQKGDTLSYNASAYKTNPDATAEDLVKKMPGITVEGGTVKAQGEDVKKVLLDGKEYFGEDATLALRNLPSEVIDKIEVFDKLSDQAQFTGFDDGNTSKTINIVTRGGIRNSQFGKVFAGYGTDDRYMAGGNISLFNGDRRISIIGLANNINQQNFATQDLLGAISNSSGGRRMRGGGGRGGFGGGAAGNFLVGQQDGITRTNSFGINFSDQWGEKVSVSGSYFFNNTNNQNDQLTNRETFLSADSSQFYDEKQLTDNTNYNHRINLRIEYKIDSANMLIFTPGVSFQKYDAFSQTNGINSFADGSLLSRSDNLQTSNTSGFNANNGILFRHAFPKRGRTISLGLNFSANDKDGQRNVEAFNTYYKGQTGLDDSTRQQSSPQSNGYQLSANIAYTEPVGRSGQLQVNYNPSWSKNNADQQTFLFDDASGKYAIPDTSLSNVFDNTYQAQRAGLTYRVGNRDKMLALGLSYQYSELNSNQVFPLSTTVHRTFSNLLPNAMMHYRFSTNSRLRLIYRASTSEPSISQLQNVINNSNPLFISTGNPDLQQQSTHLLISRYSFTNPGKGLSFFANVFLQNTQDYVSNATYVASQDSVLTPTVTLYRGSQLSKPINVDGYWSVRSFLTFGVPLQFIKTNLNWNAGFTWARTPGVINNVMNTANSYNYNLGAVFSSNISEYVDFTVSYSANFNDLKNSIQPTLNNTYFSQAAGLRLNLLSKNGWVFSNDLTNQLYSGLTDGFNQQYWLWNVSAGKKFLKGQRGELRVSVFDLLNQNRSITRTNTETYVEDVQTQVLQQYFMLTFTYKIKNFKTNKAASEPEGDEERFRRPDGLFRRPGEGPPPGMMRPGGGAGMP
ncbi:outer membrane receptor protein involved in Fe transport [Chitinophaga japonensis]|uniref:Outer membrane receptor protein involved in Fe transport n=2 Tax=Chitinophaga japonensis TaxID=104662 RepID=A0A562T5W1_CHIJA|nr:outer membrane receptor protein involved in Fe transport [Chitinophaga japonensis]